MQNGGGVAFILAIIFVVIGLITQASNIKGGIIMEKEKSREYVGSIKADGISPKSVYDSKLDDLKSVGFKLTEEQTDNLVKELKKALEKKEEWKYLNITGYRDNNQVTVTYYKPKK